LFDIWTCYFGEMTFPDLFKIVQNAQDEYVICDETWADVCWQFYKKSSLEIIPEITYVPWWKFLLLLFNHFMCI